jgi:very-short-patch-repair endonuclease
VHFDKEARQTTYDIWRQGILERAGWRFVRISHRDWERDSTKQVERVQAALHAMTI